MEIVIRIAISHLTATTFVSLLLILKSEGDIRVIVVVGVVEASYDDISLAYTIIICAYEVWMVDTSIAVYKHYPVILRLPCQLITGGSFAFVCPVNDMAAMSKLSYLVVGYDVDLRTAAVFCHDDFVGDA